MKEKRLIRPTISANFKLSVLKYLKKNEPINDDPCTKTINLESKKTIIQQNLNDLNDDKMSTTTSESESSDSSSEIWRSIQVSKECNYSSKLKKKSEKPNDDDDDESLPVSNVNKKYRKESPTEINNNDNIQFKTSPLIDKKTYFQMKSKEWKNNSKLLIDSHCHFEMLFKRLKYNGTIGDYFNDYGHLYIDNFEACINVICDPSTYCSEQKIQNVLNFFEHKKIKSTVGCHPHFAAQWTESLEELLMKHLDDPRVVAIGECGLDSSHKNKVDMKKQEIVFEKQLQIAKQKKKAIVIHCRGMEERAFELMIKHLSNDHKIHLHCFTGTWSCAQKYLNEFENLCIGITPLVTLPGKKSVDEIIENIPLERLLFETDAPYFVPRLKDVILLLLFVFLFH
jgi:TatD DNase family protein